MTTKLEFIETNGIKLHVAIAGPENGKPIILLHGFPDAWFGWERQIPALVDEGYRIIIPNQRGYNLSDKPKGKKNYTMEILLQDILGLADKLGLDKFYLTGHDFGAMVAWWMAIYHPERIEKLIISNVPHPKVMRDFLKKNKSQMRKSWYAFFFRIPKIPERVVRARNWRFLSSVMAKGLTKKQLDRYREAWTQPDAMTGMINWYRAFGKKFSVRAKSFMIEVPTTILWGKEDPHISYEMAELSKNMCKEGKLITFEKATHWVHHDEPEEFNKQLISFLQS